MEVKCILFGTPDKCSGHFYFMSELLMFVFVAITFQEDPGTAVERLNDRDYLFGKPHETLD